MCTGRNLIPAVVDAARDGNADAASGAAPDARADAASGAAPDARADTAPGAKAARAPEVVVPKIVYFHLQGLTSEHIGTFYAASGAPVAVRAGRPVPNSVKDFLSEAEKGRIQGIPPVSGGKWYELRGQCAFTDWMDGNKFFVDVLKNRPWATLWLILVEP